MKFWETETTNLHKDKAAVKDDQGNILSYKELNEQIHLFDCLTGFRELVIVLVPDKNAASGINTDSGIHAARGTHATRGTNATFGSMESLLGYLSCIRNHHIPLMLSENINQDRLMEYIIKYGINAIWMPVRKKTELDKLCRNRHLPAIYQCICSYGSYSLYHISDVPVTVHEELALLLTTSGSTGTGKLVRISYKNLRSNTMNIAKSLAITSYDMAVVSLPMYYTYGLSVINTHLYKNATLFITKSPPYSSKFWEMCKKYEVTSFTGVPYTYELLHKMGFHNMELPSLKTLTVAGGRLGKKEEQYYTEYAMKNHKRFFVMYGQTEATARISCRPCHIMNKKTGSAGIPIPEGEVWIEDQDGKRSIESCEIGEVVYRGSNVSMGYACSQEDFSRGYDWGDILHTKDLGYQDEDGCLYLIGRKDRVVKVNGVRIDLEEMEKMLKKEYGHYEFQCEVEKCAELCMVKKIQIRVSTNDGRKKIMDSIEDILVSYLVEKTGFGRKFFHVIMET